MLFTRIHRIDYDVYLMRNNYTTTTRNRLGSSEQYPLLGLIYYILSLHRLVFIIESLEKHIYIYVSNGVRVSRLYVETLGRPQAKYNGDDSGEDRLSRKLTSHES